MELPKLSIARVAAEFAVIALGVLVALGVERWREFAALQYMETDLDARVYFARPCASWKRGTNENTNGLLRQYFPKRRSLAQVTEQEIAHAANCLNHRPRKCLGFKTPHEVSFGEKHQLTVALTS